jgi:hypothetical protein
MHNAIPALAVVLVALSGAACGDDTEPLSRQRLSVWAFYDFGGGGPQVRFEVKGAHVEATLNGVAPTSVVTDWGHVEVMTTLTPHYVKQSVSPIWQGEWLSDLETLDIVIKADGEEAHVSMASPYQARTADVERAADGNASRILLSEDRDVVWNVLARTEEVGTALELPFTQNAGVVEAAIPAGTTELELWIKDGVEFDGIADAEVYQSATADVIVRL